MDDAWVPSAVGRSLLDQGEGAFGAADPVVEQDGRGRLEVALGALEERRNLPLLGDHPPRPVVDRGEVEDEERVELRGEHFGVGVRIVLPRADATVVEERPLDGREQRFALGRVGGGEAVESDGARPRSVQLGAVALDRAAGESSSFAVVVVQTGEHRVAGMELQVARNELFSPASRVLRPSSANLPGARIAPR
jgi:hypothetical protein